MAPAQASQRRIYDAAVRLFAERGVVPVNVSELASAAGVARGTIYNNLGDPDRLFGEIAGQLGEEMHQRVVRSFGLVEDPAHRLANGIRFFARRAHEEPHWGRFIVRFAFSNAALQSMWAGPPAQDLQAGLANGRYDFAPEQLPSIIAMIAGAGLSAMFLVLEGHKTWRDAGSEAAMFVLRGLGVPADDARALAEAELPPLPLLD
jgi:AcrR family transcriptional regulator